MFRLLIASLGTACVVASLGVHAQTYSSVYNGVTTVEVFANSAMLITPTRSDNYRLLIHRMDTMEQVKMAINQQIPRGGEGPARAWFAANQDRIKRQIRPAAIAAANAISRANHYKIDRLPAIVVNGRAVVYGMTDVDAALQRYQATRALRK
ncbi:TIGR03757 family integrating conjugative element protein [Variovorax sp. ZS18.2.2]|uniref:TIGR03757 family integrating conjugative element protein n=1 Tax=Variovorax sp. ZS18.2.2 TaxID=2971255 RepID=UPI002151DBED|nr:TIGR03757 family integrating conjugative element protein [Variovorax sp. ZS18.2.2]MCR6480994.1 TIGR03757 family integrating conjugative element protein [Variovorax sp. ZS18.2.2]